MKFQENPRPYINPYLGGVLLGIVLFLAYYLTSNGLGASGAVSRVQIALVDLVAPSHVDRVAYFAEKAGGNINALDSGSVFMLLGVFIGGMLSGIANRRLKPETRKGPGITDRERWVFAFIGGAVMGYGARMARGCTSGQALSGGAVLAVGSWVFMFCVFIGGYALAYFVRRLWN
ncbi:MAG: YeeE/YedE family protein [Spirochaetes bacterium]|jgi:hypothetical protein|nr:YeeE/YedE family protein [Spirochaetota bacterium]